MADTTGSSFSAADSFLGYIYQCEYALYRLLDRDRPIDAVMIEALDDVQADKGADPAELLQLKLHGPGKTLTDRGEDLWKTLRVWASHVASGDIDPSRTDFCLMTTSAASASSKLAKLLAPESDRSPSTRDVVQATARLKELAEEALDDADLSSKSVRRKAAHVLLELPPPKRAELVRNIRIVTEAPTVPELRKGIVNRLRMSGCTDAHVESLAQHVLGWWYGVIVRRLTDNKAPISAEALTERISELVSAFALSSLKSYPEIGNPDAATLAELQRWMFVRQLQAIGLPVSNVLVGQAMIEFYRAEGHIKRWTQDLRLTQDELERYEQELIGHWSISFGLATAECAGAQPDEAVYGNAGRSVLKDTMNSNDSKLKGFDGDFVRRGCYHRLTNRPVIGWHPLWPEKFSSGGTA